MTEFTQHLAALGPFAIALGAAFEGQTAVIAGGVMARSQILSPAVVVLAAALGSGIVDYLLFVLGRSFRHTSWVKKIAAKPAFDKALVLIERYPAGFILSFRFLYGLRAAGPVAVGVSSISTRKFAVLNAIAAGIWAGAFVALGYAFGPAVMSLLSAIFAHAAPIAAGVAVVAVVLGVAFWRWRVWISQERLAP
ncbi:MAG: VTT domain-containing protein [Alphaproteobacteria bacterium]|nr:VTT domain-containing protein [Alphaproteobacteria bacterium]MBU1514017.1 VTT domain-containing protein [Alphaproteobacteria bacterium]MBU2093043.1 VTT domain-containing protein [Alphaproteobacteria bacterium]MBU2151754.1 VTT domain-containing protein [Alphaproteobacteria bacterium]MBU2309426.1 VTT domain-containing protein [Alphaproteobacteria bacterium]